MQRRPGLPDGLAPLLAALAGMFAGFLCAGIALLVALAALVSCS